MIKMMRVLVVILLLMVVGCGSKIIPKYKVGEMVQMKLDQRQGMVCSTSPCGGEVFCSDPDHTTYVVRFESKKLSVNLPSLFGGQATLGKETYEKLWVREFEIERAE